MGNRLQRGRTYARKGQVISLEVDPGSVTAQVQGSRAAAVPGADRDRRVRQGRMGPGGAEPGRQCLVHREAARRRDARRHRGRLRRARAVAVPGDRPASCRWTAPAPIRPCRASTLPRPSTCWPSPFDDDPFAILAWRGREREDLLANLAAARTEGPPAADRAEQAARPLVDCLDTLLRMASRRQSPEPAGDAIDGAARPAPRHQRRRPRTAADRTAATRLSRPRTRWPGRTRMNATRSGRHPAGSPSLAANTHIRRLWRCCGGERDRPESRAETAAATVVRSDSNHGSSPCQRGYGSAPGRSVQTGTGRP